MVDGNSDGVGAATSVAATSTVSITAQNDAPSSANDSKTILEDTSTVLALTDFGTFSDPDTGDSQKGVKIVSLPTSGTVTLNGSAVLANQVITTADINNSNLRYVPASDNINAASLGFAVVDQSDAVSSTYTLSFNFTSVNDAPSGTDGSISASDLLEDSNYTFAAADFGFSDTSDADDLHSVKITTLPGTGVLKLDGSAVSAGDYITAAELASDKLTYSPVADGNGNNYASFTFQVKDDGGTTNSGLELDPSANTMTLNVGSVNDAPAGSDNTITIDNNGSSVVRAFSASDFGFSDSTDGDTLFQVKLTSLPTDGSITYFGTSVSSGQLILGSQLANLKYTIDGTVKTDQSFTFQVVDTGGTSNSGVNMDQSANTITVDVTMVGTTGDDTLTGDTGVNTINGGNGADTITGGAGDDILSGEAGADIYTFASTAALNGSDSISFVVADDVLDFAAFLSGGSVDLNGGSSPAITSYTADSNGDVNIADKVVLFDTTTTGLSVANLVSEIEGAGNAFALDGKAVVITGDADSSASPALVYFVDSSVDSTSSDVTSSDVTLVGTLSGSFDLDTLTANNFDFS